MMVFEFFGQLLESGMGLGVSKDDGLEGSRLALDLKTVLNVVFVSNFSGDQEFRLDIEPTVVDYSFILLAEVKWNYRTSRARTKMGSDSFCFRSL